MDTMKRLLEVLNDLVESVELDPSRADFYLGILQNIYNNDFRHSYFEISKCLEQFSPDQRDALCGHLDSIIEKANEKYPKGNNFTKQLMKLYDHVNLEVIRLGRMDKIKFIGDNVSSDSLKTRELLTDNQKQVRLLKKSISGFHSQSITILGIFASLVVAFFTLSNMGIKSFENINNLSFYKTILYLIVLGFIIYNVLFMLIYAISKISKNSIAVNCKDRDCDECPRCNYTLPKLNHKYPYVLWFNVFTIILATALIIFMACNNMLN